MVVNQVANQVTIREAATKLGVSDQTIRRRLHSGLIKGHQDNPPNGPWWVELDQDLGLGLGDQDPAINNGHHGNGTGDRATEELIAVLTARVQAQDEELEARRREVRELHVLLGQAQAALPAPLPAPSKSWWNKLIRRRISDT